MFDDLFRNNTDKCVKCGSENIEMVVGQGKFISKSSYEQLMKCNNCGYEWKIILNDKLELVVK
jgi:uncharacterized Zn finger protein